VIGDRLVPGEIPQSDVTNPAIVDARQSLDKGLYLTLALCWAGLLLGLALYGLDDAFFRAHGEIVSLYFFRNQDTVWFGICLILVAGLIWLGRGRQPIGHRLFVWMAQRVSLGVAGSTLFLFIVAAVGTHLIYHEFGLSLDEYSAQFQASILAGGKLLAELPSEWRDFSAALQPFYVLYDPEQGVWASVYLPVAAAIRAAFSLLSVGSITSAILTTVAVLAVAAIARRLWPDRPDAALVAVILLASSPQVLVTAMTPYAMSAQLCLNTLWLWLFLRDDRLGHGLAPWLGVAAVGLHRIHAHTVFVLPFLLSLLLARRWRLALYYGVVYAGGHLLWILWFDLANTLSLDGASPNDTGLGVTNFLWQVTTYFSLPHLHDFGIIAFNMLRFVAWQNIALIPLIVVALFAWSRCPPVVRYLAWGCLLSLLPPLLFSPRQGHGWGYRDLHGLLGGIALIGAYGWILMARLDREEALMKRARSMLVVATLASVLVALPLRAVQVERVVRPFAASVDYIRSLAVDVVLIDAESIWYGVDLVRNDPFLRNRPKVMVLQRLTPDLIERLCPRYSVQVVDQSSLARYGMSEAASDLDTESRKLWDPRTHPNWRRCGST
jgi:hypothetical protein